QGPERRAMTGIVAALLSCIFLLIAPGDALAKKHALLIGVAEYDNPSIKALSGPRNDVILLWRYLTGSGFEPADIHVLAEGLPEDASVPRANAAPTRAAIIDGFRNLAEQAQQGDFVVVHFSGHGTTQPQTASSASAMPEAGDRDQVLLPKDAGDYDNAARTIRNGLVDDEIGEALDAIRAKGATVWAIIDACHAGTVTRSGAVATRGTQPDALGVPASPTLRSAQRPPQAQQREGLVRDMGGKASLVGFFAVDSWTEAIEREQQFSGTFAPGPRGGAPRFGVFTYHLVRALNSGRAQTFRDLARLISLDIATSGSLAQAPPPFFDGDLDLTIAGGEAKFARRFPAAMEDGKIMIDAGALQGFDEDAEVALFDGPLEDARRLVAARIESADAARATAVVKGQPPAGSNLWASVEAPGIALRFRVGVRADDDVERAKVRELVQRAVSAVDAPSAIGIEIVDEGERDIDVHLAHGRLWLAPEGKPLEPDQTSYTRSLPIDFAGRPAGDTAADLRKALFAFARAANLVRVASAAELGGRANDDVQISLERVRETDPARLANAQRACSEFTRPTPAAPLASGDSAPLGHCDQVRISVSNRGDRDLFIGVFYLNPIGGVAVPVPAWRQNGCVTYLPAKSTTPLKMVTTVRTWTATGPSHAGLHRVLVFAIPRTQTSALNLCHLLQPDAEAARREVVALRNAGGRKGLLGLLDRVASAEPNLRSANPFEDSPEESASILVRQYTLDVRPPVESQ
ncbi:MAG: caspase family protein, partial [Beijerinckiaceae bacterium]|nr:caspase family protein [Beijerinckiaceae bacterium]